MSLFSRISQFMTSQPDPNALNVEFNNIENVLNNLDSGNQTWNTVNSKVLQVSGVNVVSSKVVQYITATATLGVATTSSTFTNTNLAVTITPTSASNKVFVMAVGSLGIAAPNQEAFATLKRGSTNIMSSTGMGYSRITSTATVTALFSTCTLIWMDSPATTTATTYTVAIANGDNATNVRWSDANASSQFIIALEMA